MSQELAPGGRSRCSDAGFQRIVPMKLSAIAALLPLVTAWCLLCADPAFAQVEDPLDPLTAVPSLGVTTPLGMGSNGSVGATGIPLGSTEVTSLGTSPAPTGGVTGTIALPTSGAITSSGTTCSTVGTSLSGMYGSTATYDGGGTASGSAAPATAANTGATANSGTSPSSATSVTLEMPISSGTLDTSGTSGMCGSGSSSIASSSMPTSTSPTVPGGGARTGIPLGSFEIGNLGVSSTPPVPVPSVLPTVGIMGPSSVAPTMPTVSPTTSPATTASNPACAMTGASGIGSFAGAGNAGIPGTSISERTLRQFILCQR
ncbi:hypothetical protein SAMN05443247_02556 [Bradyrhizobium erythrophlei]|jgi:hypothetical protein|nr:hypothetical protein SAMN05443247_02556 [Bradyrhizobium erythrophlei]